MDPAQKDQKMNDPENLSKNPISDSTDTPDTNLISTTDVGSDTPVESTTIPQSLDSRVIKSVEQVKGWEDLTEKNRVFISLIASGMRTAEAHKMAGYTGKKTAAYELRSQLLPYINQVLEAEGVDETGLKIGFNQLLSIPLDPMKQHLTFNEKLRLLMALEKSITNSKNRSKEVDIKKLTPFVINVGSTESVQINEAK